MTLNEFMLKRLEELQLKKADLVNKYDLEWSTLTKIAHGHSIRQGTQQKLAIALQCTQGDIQKCLAEQNPLKNVIVNKKSLAKQKKTEDEIVKKVMEEKPYLTPEPEPDEMPFIDEPEAEPEDDMMFPVETEAETDNRITREVAEEMYKRKLKDMVGKILARTHCELTDKVRQEIGVALLNELWPCEDEKR